MNARDCAVLKACKSSNISLFEPGETHCFKQNKIKGVFANGVGCICGMALSVAESQSAEVFRG